LRLFPRPAPHELARYYPENYYFTPDADAGSQIAELYRRAVLADHVRFIRRAVEKIEGPLLDVGCSGGLLDRLLRDGGTKALGLDNAEHPARLAWTINAVPVMCADLLAAPLRDGSFAAVTMFHLLEHVPDPRAYLAAAKRLLKPDGRLIVQVPNAASWQFLIFGENWNGIDVPRHLWNFRASDLEWLLQECGFEVVRRKFFSLRDNPAGMASSIAPGLDPMARRVRGIRESGAWGFAKNLAYLGLTLACLPFAALEALCRAGSTVMVEARVRPTAS
jgi:SAM-dependent methyltransferase